MKDERLTVAESLLLDVIRVGAAILVTAGHLTQPAFSTGWPNCISLAVYAVAIFFVLSGFVVRYVTCQRRANFQVYLIDRGSRIYSVVIPALLFTVVADVISWHVHPGFHAQFSGKPMTWDGLGGVAANLFFVGQVWAVHWSPLSNLPFWSLNYEVAYYLLYGCAFYLRGWSRWFWTGLLVLVLGPKILILLPVWWSGSLAHDLYQRWNAKGTTKRILNLALLMSAAITGVVGLVLLLDRHLLRAVLRLHRVVMTYAENPLIGGNSLMYFVIALFGTMIFLRVLLAVRDVEIDPKGRPVRWIRFVAEGTFPMYLLHFPLLVLIASCVPYDHGSAAQKLMILFILVATGVAAGHPFNLLKMQMRQGLRRLVPTGGQ